MRDYRLTKMTESIMRQTQMSPKEAHELAVSIYDKIDWKKKPSFTEAVKPYINNGKKR